MKLIFSTAYDKDVFKCGPLLNTKYVGELGLLNCLERELGLYDIYLSDKERAERFLSCLELHKSDSFFEKALNTDKLKVAEELLSYRDELILLGWDSKRTSDRKRFIDLSNVEKDFVKVQGHKGFSDRWEQVITSLNIERTAEFNISEICIEDSENDLPYHIKTVFKKLSDSVKCSYSVMTLKGISNTGSNLELFKSELFKSIINNEFDEKSESILRSYKEDSSLLLLNFENRQVLTDTIAYIADHENCLVINRDNTNFDFSLVSFGKPASGSKQINSNPQVIQLIKLIIPCFSKAINLETFISFMDLPISPLDFKLSRKLMRLLVRQPGFYNQEWKSTVTAYTGEILKKDSRSEKEEELIKYFGTQEASEEELEKRKTEIELFLMPDNEDDKKALRKAEKIIRYIKEWSEETVKNQNLELKEQFKYLTNLCSAILQFDFKNKTREDLEAKIKSEYESHNFTNYFKQTGSVDVISDISSIASETNRSVYWMDFHHYNEKLSGDFLLQEEITQLNAADLMDSQIKLQLRQWLRGLLNVNRQLVLCTIENSEAEKHPLHLRLETLFKNSFNAVSKTINSLDDLYDIFEIKSDQKVLPEKIKLESPKDYINTEIFKKIKPRKKESASSIEKLIEYPFDWTMQYIAKFSNDVGFKLPDDNLVKGNVAHRVIEKLFTAYPDLDFEDTHRDEIFYETLNEMGAVFLQPEKRFDLSEFKYIFNKSLQNLVEIIKLNQMKIRSCEYAFGKEEDYYIKEIQGNAVGYIDLVLKDRDKRPFIIDLKWSYSDKKYKEKIKENEAVQLALYTAAINEREVAQTAYYMLNQNLMITSKENLKGKRIIHFKTDEDNLDVLEKIKKSVEFRRKKEFEQGIIEMGDNCSFENLNYYENDSDFRKRISLPKDSKKKYLKKEYPYSGYKLFKGFLK